MTARPCFRALILACIGLPHALAAQPLRSEVVREEFRAAWNGAVAGETARADSPALVRYVLYPYVQALRLRNELARVPADRRDAGLERRVRALLDAQKRGPATWDLERAWLTYLARRAAWAEFVAEAPDTLSDPSLRCHAITARIVLDDLDGLRERALALWLSPESKPEACKPVLDWIDSRERLSDADIVARARVAIQRRQALPKMLDELPADRRAVLLTWDRLMAQPGRGLERFLAGANLLAPDPRPDVPASAYNEALLDVFERLARRDSHAADGVFRGLLKYRGFGDAEHGQLRRAYALGLAYDHRPEAVTQFRDVPDEALDALAHEWRARAALFHGEWRRALGWIEAMPEALRAQPRWLYWRARLHEMRRDRDRAEALYAEAAREREYYAFLSAERLGRVPDLRPAPIPQDGATLDLLAASPAMLRTLELLQVEMPDLALAEFRHALRDLPDSARAQAVRLADAWGWHHGAVLLLSELKLWDDLWMRFPLPFQDEVERAAKASSIPEDWIHAVIRTETLYNPDAVSSADALGLMQLRLPTARQVASRAGRPVPARGDLFRPDVNVALGAGYLRDLHDRFGQRWPLTLAAYNAGPHRVPSWLPDFPVDADVWVENIPYNETREYVQRAFSTQVVIGWRRTGRPAPILPHLPVFEPARKGKGR